MPLLKPSPFLIQQIIAYLDKHEIDAKHGELSAAFCAWGGQALQQRRSSGANVPLPPIPFTLVKRLHHALGAGQVRSHSLPHPATAPTVTTPNRLEITRFRSTTSLLAATGAARACGHLPEAAVWRCIPHRRSSHTLTCFRCPFC
jgi:hypothetical protein